MVAAYTAVTAGLIALTQPTDSDPEPDDLLLYRWIVYAVLVLGSIGLTYFSYIGKAGSSGTIPSRQN